MYNCPALKTILIIKTCGLYIHYLELSITMINEEFPPKPRVSFLNSYTFVLFVCIRLVRVKR